jgi:hypothetical protein
VLAVKHHISNSRTSYKHTAKQLVGLPGCFQASAKSAISQHTGELLGANTQHAAAPETSTEVSAVALGNWSHSSSSSSPKSMDSAAPCLPTVAISTGQPMQPAAAAAAQAAAQQAQHQAGLQPNDSRYHVPTTPDLGGSSMPAKKNPSHFKAVVTA